MMEDDDIVTDVPLGQPEFRWDDLNANNTVWDRMKAAPSDKELQIMWLITGITNVVISIALGIVSIAILSSRKVRQNAFNNFLLYLMFPDFVFTFTCVFTCLISAGRGHYASPNMCNFQAVYISFGLSANAWLNALTASEVYKLLRSSHLRKKYFPPKRKHIAYKALAIYVFCILLGCLSLMSGQMMSPMSISGLYCFAGTHDRASDLFFWLVFAPLSIGIPYLYVFWVVFDVTVRSKLLPAKGKRRELSIYFFRIFFVFYVMWLPTIAADFMGRGRASPWVVWATATWGHLQGLASAAIACLKPDIAIAVKDLLLCRQQPHSTDNQTHSERNYDGLGISSSIFWNSAKNSDKRAAPDRSGDMAIPSQDHNFQFSDEASKSMELMVCDESCDELSGIHPFTNTMGSHPKTQDVESNASAGDISPA